MAHQLYYKAVLLRLLVALLRAQKLQQILARWVRQVDDETLEIKVENALDKDAQIKSEGRVHAVSYSGRVLLIGQVPSESVKETATSLAKGVEGVNDVYNELRVGPKITFGQITKDSWITTQIKSNSSLAIM